MKVIRFLLVLFFIAFPIMGQNFNFTKINKGASEYTVTVNIKIEVSLGMQTTEAQNRSIGTIVSPDGLVMFDGFPIDNDNPYSMIAGMQINTEPKSIEITMSDGT
ncbi:MAG: hypothetical protein NTV06_06860, partial [candidate division Zixibacteria bacterium]|nr:hypothetical protein [candidate division Zixibacteria bacterium]